MVDKTCELFDSGHRACGGCGAALAARLDAQGGRTEFHCGLFNGLHGGLLHAIS